MENTNITPMPEKDPVKAGLISFFILLILLFFYLISLLFPRIYSDGGRTQIICGDVESASFDVDNYGNSFILFHPRGKGLYWQKYSIIKRENTDPNDKADYEYNGEHEVLLDSTPSAGFFSDILILNDKIYICYYTPSTGDFNFIISDKKGGIMEKSLIDTQNTGGYPCLKTDEEGNPMVSYYDFKNKTLKFAYFNEGNWFTETVDSTPNRGWFSYLNRDQHGNPAISYYDDKEGDLLFAHVTNQGWDVDIADARGDRGWFTYWTFDKENIPTLFCFDSIHRHIRKTQLQDNQWNSRYVYLDKDPDVPVAFAGTPGENFWICYVSTEEKLILAREIQAGWESRIVDQDGNNIKKICLKLPEYQKEGKNYKKGTSEEQTESNQRSQTDKESKSQELQKYPQILFIQQNTLKLATIKTP